MTARQIIQEFQALSPKEQEEVLSSLQGRLSDEKAVYAASTPSLRYLDHEAARPMIKEILDEHAELFRKLSQ